MRSPIERARTLIPALLLALGFASAARADGGANADSVYLVGEFVDPVCVFQHGMLGTIQKQCAMVRGRVDQGMYFLDVRKGRLYSVIGQNHWDDPKQGFLDALGDTFAVSGKVWRYGGSSAIAITGMWPYREQPAPRYRWWPIQWEWSVLAGCGLLAALYLIALTRLRRRFVARIEPWRIVCFLGALVVVIFALDGPIHDLSDLYLFSAHMVQHLMLAQLFPLLLLLGLPPWLKRWLVRPRAVATVWNFLASIPLGFIIYSVVIGIYHTPAFYNLMMRNHDIHIVMHLGLMGTALMMWWPVLAGDVAKRPLTAGAQMLYLFLLGTPMMLVAAIITFADHSLYPWYALAPRFMAMSAVEDQRLGGLIMWVPGGLFYWLVMSVVFFRWSEAESRASVEDPILTGPTPEAPALTR